MKYFFYLTIFHFISNFSLAQSTASGNNERGIDIAASYTGFVTELTTVEKKSVGSAYLFDDYRNATIIFLNGDSVQLPVNLDISTNQVEMIHDGQVKVATGRVVKRIQVFHNQDITNFDYDYVELPNESYFGLANKFYSGDNFSVTRIFEFETKEGYYVKALDVGDNNITYKINEIYVFHGKNGEVKIVDTDTKRKFSKEFSQSDLILQYIKKNKLDLRNENDLTVVFEFIDSNL